VTIVVHVPWLVFLLGSPPAFMQCGEWVFPLVPGKSPVLKAADTTYMFPELQGDGVFIIILYFSYCVSSYLPSNCVIFYLSSYVAFL